MSTTSPHHSPWRWIGAAGTVATLTIVVVRLGTGPFIDGVRAVDGRLLWIGAAVTVVTTLCSAWRWAVVARGLGVELPLRAAVASSYRSQFLNLTLPGGVLGDVHRGVSHGRAVHDLGRGLRAVMWERLAGQVVQAVLTTVVLVAMPSPVRSAVAWIVATLAVTLLIAFVLARALPAHGESRWTRARGALAGDLRNGLLPIRTWWGVAAASAVAVVGYAVMFVMAAHAVGVDASVATLLPLTVLAMLAMVLPSAAGIGPREGATAWAFGTAGLGADRGVATAVAYGVMTLVASMPGAVVILVGLARRARRSRVDVAAFAVQSDGRHDG